MKKDDQTNSENRENEVKINKDTEELITANAAAFSEIFSFTSCRRKAQQSNPQKIGHGGYGYRKPKDKK